MEWFGEKLPLLFHFNIAGKMFTTIIKSLIIKAYLSLSSSFCTIIYKETRVSAAYSMFPIIYIYIYKYMSHFVLCYMSQFYPSSLESGYLLKLLDGNSLYSHQRAACELVICFRLTNPENMFYHSIWSRPHSLSLECISSTQSGHPHAVGWGHRTRPSSFRLPPFTSSLHIYTLNIL